MAGTISLEDMRLFAAVADAKSITLAARSLRVPKQTLSRRVAGLERALGVELLRRTTRSLSLTPAGIAYAERCAQIVRIAEAANRAASASDDVPRGKLRVTADPIFGEAFVGDLVIEYARRWPEVTIELVLTRRRVDLGEEGFDAAFRVGDVGDEALRGMKLGPARVRYCASPAYLADAPPLVTPKDLARHACILAEDMPPRWPFRGRRGLEMIGVRPRLTLSSAATTRAACVAGLGVSIFPEFACAEDIREKRLVPVLDDHRVDVGFVWFLHAGKPREPRVRALADLARERFGASPPWVVA
jgi:DNA-binding transcriptional LysR family regulator